ncbi:glycosyltransferase family 39 protein [Pseudarthrobacter sp. NPDC080039]|uniref:glycosyltransferase family 39 protein n=1 Tax=unclassified Pseudarthrobacter TaxID=2647000 RepID=UPI00344B7C94
MRTNVAQSRAAILSSPSRALMARERVISILTSGHTPWERPALLSLLLLTALLYCWGLDINGWANAYYSAAVMSGAQDWTAFFYGSSDPLNAITVDKPPLSLWVMALSVRLFGLSSWSILLPQAVMGVLAVFLLYVLVSRRFGPFTGLLAAVFMAITPVSTVMFRYNNPDALLILIMVATCFYALRAIDKQRPLDLIVAGALVGAGFLTKQLQIGLVIPGLVLAYLVFGRASWFKRMAHVGLAGMAAAAVAGAWLLIVQLSDVTARPFIGGSRENSTVELALGYNGFQRLTGEDASRTLSSGGRVNELAKGYQRFLEPQYSGQFGWFLPLAFVGLGLAMVWLIKRKGNSSRGALLLFSGSWFLTSTGVLAYMSGIVHPYYALTAVPPSSVLAAVSLRHLLSNGGWRNRALLVAGLVGTAVLAFVSATRSAADFPDLPQLFLLLWPLTIAAQIVPNSSPALRKVRHILMISTLIAGPLIWSINTALSPHVGAGVIAGPSINGIRSDDPTRSGLGAGVSQSLAAVALGDIPEPKVLDRLTSTKLPSRTWATAIVGSASAANYQLATGRPVLPIGGFDGTDPSPTLEQFRNLVEEKKIASVVVQNLPPLTSEGRGESARILDWVKSNFKKEQIGNAEYYDLVQLSQP